VDQLLPCDRDPSDSGCRTGCTPSTKKYRVSRKSPRQSSNTRYTGKRSDPPQLAQLGAILGSGGRSDRSGGRSVRLVGARDAERESAGTRRRGLHGAVDPLLRIVVAVAEVLADRVVAAVRGEMEELRGIRAGIEARDATRCRATASIAIASRTSAAPL
jgi:hypothetical protein